jgi:hypothetical protein
LFSGQPLAMPPIIMPAWQKGTPQSMQRAPCAAAAPREQRDVKLVKIADALQRRQLLLVCA